MSSKITIIGAGSVGATIAYTLSQKSIASEIVLIDINKQKAEGEVMDIDQGTSFREPISIVAGDYPDAADSDIVIITSGIARKPGQTRIELTQTNVNIMKSITPEIVKVAPKALYIIVSNPCDIMTYAFAKFPVFRSARSLVPELHWTLPVSAADFPSTMAYRRRIFMPMYSESMEILPLYRGQEPLLQVRPLMNLTRSFMRIRKICRHLTERKFWSMFILQDQLLLPRKVPHFMR